MHDLYGRRTVQIQMHEQQLQMQQQLQQLQSGQPAGGDASMGGGGSLSTNHQHASTNLFVPLQPLGLIGLLSNSSSSSLAFARSNGGIKSAQTSVEEVFCKIAWKDFG